MQTIKHLNSKNKILQHENKGLIEALKKQKQKPYKHNLLLGPQLDESNSLAKIYTPNNILYILAEKQRIKEEQNEIKAQKEDKKAAREAAKCIKNQLVAERQIAHKTQQIEREAAKRAESVAKEVAREQRDVSKQLHKELKSSNQTIQKPQKEILEQDLISSTNNKEVIETGPISKSSRSGRNIKLPQYFRN